MSDVRTNFTKELLKWGLEGEVKFYSKSGDGGPGILEKVDSEA